MESPNNPNIKKSDIEKVDLSIQKSNIFESESKLTTAIKDTKVNVEVKKENPVVKDPKKEGLIKNILIGVIVLNVLFAIFLHSQISFNLFGENLSSQKEATSNELIAKKAEINKFNLLVAAYSLDNFVLNSEDYISHMEGINSSLTSSNKKESLKKDLADIENNIKSSVETIKNSTYSLSSDEAESELIKSSTRELLNNYKLELSATRNESNEAAIQDEVKNINTVIGLIDNVSTLNLVKSVETEKIDEEKLVSVLKKIYSTQNSNLSLINNLDHRRINWTSILDEIDLITRKVDPLYGSALSENIGQISYKTFQLEQSKENETVVNKIVINGQIKTPNSKNFNISSDLIDEIERSEMFANADMRSFTKKLNSDGSYLGNFNITFYLEQQSITEPTNQ